MGKLAGRTALVTGAARGQGAATARRFVAEGATVIIADVLDDEGKRLADELNAFPVGDPGDQTRQPADRPIPLPAARFCHLDVSEEDEWAAVLETAGPVTILVNNAGILHFGSVADTTLADYERVIRVNQTGTFLGMRAVVPGMIAAGGGSIVNTSSIEGLAAAPLLLAYTASKFAIRGMTKVAAMELGGKGIRVNSVHPGMIDTPMLPTALGGIEVDLDRIGRKVPLRRVGRAEEIAGLITFLASDDSSYCTGAEFVADGGATTGHALSVT
ncbi:SDR family NAD(P)-dependent oxidoreductase [Actinophytocola sp.]|uniref:SDR family NAD(P)-dependent oxidoreductase n=1 Tax=Actinophytocola sp. TaxID=1872138 RepID=UPI002D8051D9|nr:SDR family oxidoreductase [Actinophytocola sp.]HET9141259.1 SDR family oxidoreductase [Actinophytocola sp.]